MRVCGHLSCVYMYVRLCVRLCVVCLCVCVVICVYVLVCVSASVWICTCKCVGVGLRLSQAADSAEVSYTAVQPSESVQQEFPPSLHPT